MYKITYFLAVGLFLVLGGCQYKSNSQLDALKLEMETNPDSVYTILQTLRDESKEFSEIDKMQFGLLRLKCQNALDLPFDSDDSIQTIVEYYARKGSYNDALLSMYLMGRSYMVKGNEPMAVECFNKCLALKRPTNVDIDFVQLSKVHSQLDQIYRNQDLTQLELRELTAAEECAYLGKDTVLAITYEYLKVKPYFKMGMLDSVISISNNIREKYLSYGMKDKAAEALYMAFDAHLQKKEYGKAKQCMEIFENESGAFDSSGNILPGQEIYHYVKGKLYEAYGKHDSAEYEYRRLLKHKEDICNVEAASKGLLSLYRNFGISDSIAKYADMYCEANDSSHKKSVANVISRLKAVYDYSEYKQKSEEMRIETESIKKKMIVIVFVAIILILFIAYYVYIYRKRKKIEICQLLDEYDSTLQIIEELNDNKEELLHTHQQELEYIKSSLKDKGVVLSNDNKEYAIHEDLINRFTEYGDSMGNRCSPITTEEWHKLFLEISNNDSKFMLLLRESNLSENEKKVTVLIRLHFKDYQIKRILDAYGSSLPNYKARINKKIFKQSGAKTLRRLIYAWDSKL